MLNRPGWLMVIGFVLLLVGTIVPFLIVLQMIESTFFLNFTSYLAQVAGLFLGVIGAAMYIRENRKGRKG
jgi:heme/copper-type cytochrome/quinol oxidase subunit 4